MSQAYNPYYFGWTESALRNAIWDGNSGRHWRGPFGDIDELRAELRRRGLCDRGYHEQGDEDA